LLLVLAVLGLILIPQAYAAGITFKSFCNTPGGSGTTFNCTLSGVTAADTIIVNIFGVGVFNGFTTTDGQSNSYTEKVFSLTGSGGGESTYIYATLSAASSGSLVVTVATGGPTRIYAFTASDYSGVTGFGTTGTDQSDVAGNSGSSTISLGGTGGSSLMVDDFIVGGFAVSPTISALNQQTTRDTNTAFCGTPSQCRVADGASPILGWSWSGGTGCNNLCSMSHSVMELQGAASGPVVTVSQCYGNCGSPPITLANTNSTHTINFNQSITLLYEFQSNLAGFVNNYTLNYAAICGSGNKCVANTLFMALYTIPSCPLGSTPFSTQCAGLRVSQASSSPPTKGRISAIASSVPVFIGQWVAVAVSATFSGIDINDTNTNVNLFQTNEGRTPSSISLAVPVTGTTSKMGLWVWISGNVVVGTPPTNPNTFNCAGLLDCLLPNWIGSLCFNGTPVCLAMSGLVWAGILAVFSTFVVIKFGTELMPNARIPFGEIFLFFALTWVLVMGGLAYTFVWVPLFFFFVVSILMRKNVGSYL